LHRLFDIALIEMGIKVAFSLYLAVNSGTIVPAAFGLHREPSASNCSVYQFNTPSFAACDCEESKDNRNLVKRMEIRIDGMLELLTAAMHVVATPLSSCFGKSYYSQCISEFSKTTRRDFTTMIPRFETVKPGFPFSKWTTNLVKPCNV
jgi:hypothetical protein